jgi:ubiquitin-protein ligase E3 C
MNELKKYTKYIGGFSGSSSVIKTFWTLLEKDFSEDEQGKMLKFVTSCPRPPLMGFQHLHPPFCISMMDTDRPDEKLPTASTCFNILRLPKYSNAKVMKEKLLYAINSNAGFELI